MPEDSRRHELNDVQELLEEAAKGRPELHRALADVAAKRAEIGAARAGFWPTVHAEAEYGWKDREFVPEQDEWSAGLWLNLPFFAGFDRVYQVRHAESELARAEADYEGRLRATELEVWTAFCQVVEADESIKAARKLVGSAEESAALAEAEYKTGTGSILGLIDAQTARAAAAQTLVEARLDWYTALARLERAVGRAFADTKKGSRP
jgi:outer membrane protein TolC